MKHAIFIFWVFSIFWSCTKNKTQILEQSQKKTEEIIIIFKNTPEKKKIETPIGVGYSMFFDRIAFYFDQYEEKILNPKRGEVVDTIKVEPKADVIELNLEDGKYGFRQYLLKKGDTIMLNFQDVTPIASLNNANATSVNYDSFIYNQFKKEYHEKIKFLFPMPFVSFNKGENSSQYKVRFERFREASGKRMMNDLVVENNILDSLYAEHAVSTENYQYRKNNIDFYKILYKLETGNLKANTIDSLILKSDRLIYMRTYRDLLEKLIHHRYVSQFTPGKSHPSNADSRVVFDSIIQSDNFPEQTQKYLLFNHLKNIIKNYSSEDYSAYFDKFKEEIKDSSLIHYIAERYLLDFAVSKKETKNVLFATWGKEKLRLDEILSKHKGKLIYVDFWASWCAPCRAAMPNSRALHQKYSDKGIVFLYVSIDKDLQEWMQASKEEGLLLDGENNLIALNYPEAELYRNLILSSIPRYLIYDKKGELIYKNAPAPNSAEIAELLEKLLTGK
ncbi:MAG: TlpA disulfide reductase family protein [Flavobacteriaceae bacterium]|nr:TlpA disulfide reductase family protein [Flavobacteriaceae bacterium]